MRDSAVYQIIFSQRRKIFSKTEYMMIPELPGHSQQFPGLKIIPYSNKIYIISFNFLSLGDLFVYRKTNPAIAKRSSTSHFHYS